MFDRVGIVVRGGNGGDGAISFRREKFAPFGGPDGGDGGDGGNVVIIADPGVSTLRYFKPKRVYKAGDGGDGRGKKKHGKNGQDLILTVPPGTIISSEAQIGEAWVIADLARPGEQIAIARGGKGGLGNTHFTTATNQAPTIAQKGESGEEKAIILEMRLIADVGIIGYPNVGKSSLLAAASAAKPKIASYPFTTRQPILGVIDVGDRSFVLAEIPGLIEGAHLGRGLGHDFLRHALRTKILLHLVDGTSKSPLDDLVRVNSELGLFDSALARKPQIVAVNKIDLPEVRALMGEIKEAFGKAGIPVHFISAAAKEGIPELMAETLRVLEAVNLQQKEEIKAPKKVFHPQPPRAGISIRNEDGTFIVIAPELERIVTRGDVNDAKVRYQLIRELVRLGVGRALEKAGVKPGSKVRCGNLEWEW